MAGGAAKCAMDSCENLTSSKWQENETPNCQWSGSYEQASGHAELSDLHLTLLKKIIFTILFSVLTKGPSLMNRKGAVKFLLITILPCSGKRRSLDAGIYSQREVDTGGR